MITLHLQDSLNLSFESVTVLRTVLKVTFLNLENKFLARGKKRLF